MSGGFEVNFDGLVGPTYHYGGLSYGNIASKKHSGQISNPKQAALQGLEKMKFLHDLGLKQAFLPPQQRPDLRYLNALGYSGQLKKIIEKIAKEDMGFLSACFSASNMWTANAATISPSKDCENGKIHITPANLATQLHRSMEKDWTSRLLKSVFSDLTIFQHHVALPSERYFSDEGAANHIRLCRDYDSEGIEVFVFGQDNHSKLPATKYPIRQSLQASECIARSHQLNRDRTLFVQQNPEAINAGVFHNDVISVGNLNVFFYHEKAFVETQKAVSAIRKTFEDHCQAHLYLIEVKENHVSLADAVASYLFNSQLISVTDEKMALICPSDCENFSHIKDLLNEILEKDNPIQEVHYVNVRQSMQNGGGPACLRLRVVLNDRQLVGCHSGVLFDEIVYDKLKMWVKQYYRDKLHLDDLADPKLWEENCQAFSVLSDVLKLEPSLYNSY